VPRTHHGIIGGLLSLSLTPVLTSSPVSAFINHVDFASPAQPLSARLLRAAAAS